MSACRITKWLSGALTISVVIAALAFDSTTLAAGRKTMRKPGELVRRQDPPKVSARLRDTITPQNSYVQISLSKQRAYVMVDGEVYIDTPISSGKRAGMTPTGKFSVLEKDKDHRSSVYGDFVDSKGRVVRGGVSMKIDSAPAGTHYVGAPMKFFMRLTQIGVGMHIGILPGYPASHGCVRLPAEIAPLIYEKVRVGTPVEIQP
jgi:lipoprotein-anchoring transpeptidase ErfK/SrfK